MILSDWHSGSTIPAHDGIYERKNAFEEFYTLFKNGKWMLGSKSQKQAEIETRVSMFQDWKWRGIK